MTRLPYAFMCACIPLLTSVACAAPGGASAFAADDFTVISGPASPRVAMAIKRDGQQVRLALDVAEFHDGASGTSVSIGLAAAKMVLVSDKDAQVARKDGVARYSFTVPAALLVANEEDWKKLRVGVAVAWKGGPGGEDRQRERFRHTGGATHGGLSQDPSDWLALNLTEHEALVADRKNRIFVDFDQPMDGKATVVIEDEAGNRVRNLISGRPMGRGKRRVEWDGLDEQGRVAGPGTYRWRSIHHPGIRPQYLMSFCNDGNPPWRTGSGTDMWGPDHSHLLAAAANKDFTFFGASVAESGYAMVAVDQDGVKRMQYDPPSGTGIWSIALAADDKYLYAAHDGFAWGQKQGDRSKPDWKVPLKVTVTRYDVKSGKVADFPGGKRFVEAVTYEYGPGAGKDGQKLALAGLGVLEGRLYLSDARANRILVLDAGTGAKADEIKMESPGALCARGGEILAVSGKGIVKLTGGTGEAASVISDPPVSTRGLAVDKQGNIYVSDPQGGNVRVFDSKGKPLREIGKRGGAYTGPYEPTRMVNPAGIAVAANGWLWATEDRGDPKRVSAWNTETGEIVKEKFGPTSYGAPGAGFDTMDQARWIGQGALWKLDLQKKSAACQSILGGPGASHYSFHRQDGRTFVIAFDQATTICELKENGTLKKLAMLGSTHRFCFASNWKPPAPFIEAFNKAYPDKAGKHADKGPGVLWVDRNGDGQYQAEEFEFSTKAENFAGGYWGHDFRDLTLRVPAIVKGKCVLVTLKPDGYYQGGAPRYPALNDACLAGVPIKLKGCEIETATDRFGRTVCNSDPEMKCFSPEGKTLWTYPSRWTNVHGSHTAPLPEVGVMQGTLFFLGMAPLDDAADVFAINGNHGRFFVLTSDGLYLDEMFKDVRMGSPVDAYLIGGECFGGFFGRSQKDGAYYLQSGHTDYRVFRVDGLGQAVRAKGTVNVSAEQAAAAERRLTSRLAQTAEKKDAFIPFVAAAPKIDGKEDDWTGDYTARWSKSGQFPVAVRAAYDQKNLYLYYLVADPSPWVNNGKDWTLLFKTGDSVDLQLGADESAGASRTKPVPGDLRLLIAPFEGKNIAVLYRHRCPGATDGVEFRSPWRAEKVDSVKMLAEARIAVVKEKDKYRLEASIPLSDLGLKAPAGKTFKADFGVLLGDPDGAITMLRSYWSNQATMLVNDVPGEIMLVPNLWGNAGFQERR